jgi:hypothetical protein
MCVCRWWVRGVGGHLAASASLIMGELRKTAMLRASERLISVWNASIATRAVATQPASL